MASAKGESNGGSNKDDGAAGAAPKYVKFTGGGGPIGSVQGVGSVVSNSSREIASVQISDDGGMMFSTG